MPVGYVVDAAPGGVATHGGADHEEPATEAQLVGELLDVLGIAPRRAAGVGVALAVPRSIIGDEVDPPFLYQLLRQRISSCRSGLGRRRRRRKRRT